MGLVKPDCHWKNRIQAGTTPVSFANRSLSQFLSAEACSAAHFRAVPFHLRIERAKALQVTLARRRIGYFSCRGSCASWISIRAPRPPTASAGSCRSLSVMLSYWPNSNNCVTPRTSRRARATSASTALRNRARSAAPRPAQAQISEPSRELDIHAAITASTLSEA
jgi:hypothetical protein